MRSVDDRALRDKERYHPEDPADYQGTVGVPYEKDGRVFLACCGCWWCCPEEGE